MISHCFPFWYETIITALLSYKLKNGYLLCVQERSTYSCNNIIRKKDLFFNIFHVPPEIESGLFGVYVCFGPHENIGFHYF